MSRLEGNKSILTITGNTAIPLYSSGKGSELGASKGQGQVPAKGQPVPEALLQLVEAFKNHVKEEKKLSIEVSRASDKPIRKITRDIDTVKEEISKLDRQVNKNRIMNEKLKEGTVKAVSDVEIAQKAMDHPGGFPCDHSIITDYFMQIATKFQAQVVGLRVELENTEKSIMCELNPSCFTPQELSTAMQRLYECFVALAGRFQFVHAQISNLKVKHHELRRKKLGDVSDIFSKKGNPLKSPDEINKLSFESPSPFTGFRNYQSVSMMASRGKQSYPGAGGALGGGTLGPPGMATPTPANSSLFRTSFQSPAPLLASTPAPASSSKRGKR